MKPIHVRIVRSFPYPMPVAFAWLTDIRDEDAQTAGAVIQVRKVRERSAERIVYEGETETLGRRAWSLTEVKLMPPDKWEGRVLEGPRKGSWTTYDLRAIPGGTELVVHYRFVFASRSTGALARLLKPLLRRNLGKMWDGFEAAMDEELAAPHAM